MSIVDYTLYILQWEHGELTLCRLLYTLIDRHVFT